MLVSMPLARRFTLLYLPFVLVSEKYFPIGKYTSVVNIRVIPPDTLLMAIFLNTVVIANSVCNFLIP